VTYRIEGRDLVIDGFEQGIADSPYNGIGDIRNMNLVSVTGEASVNFKTSANTILNSGALNAVAITVDATANTITITGGQQPGIGYYMAFRVHATANGLTAGTRYFAQSVASSTFLVYTKLADAIDGINGVDITSNGSNTLTNIQPGQFNYWAYDPSTAESTGTTYYNYFASDSNGEVWGYNEVYSVWNNMGNITTDVSYGLVAYQGWVFNFTKKAIACMTTSKAKRYAWTYNWQYMGVGDYTPLINHYAIVGYDDTVYYCDGPNIGSFFAISDYSKGFFTSADVGTDILNVTTYWGNPPANNSTIVFSGTTLPTGISAATTYYVINLTPVSGGASFQISTTLGGAAVNITGAGTPGDWTYMNFDPNAIGSYTFNRTALTLPANERAQSLAELGQTLLIGGTTNRIYPWNRTSSTFSSPIIVAENNIVNMVTINTNTYIFAGNRGRIYKTNGSQAQLYRKFPDHLTGKIEPYYTWKAFGYNRNQLYFSFSATDNTGTALTTTGGLWAIDIDLEVLRLVNKLSYNTYAGYATVFMPRQTITDTSNGSGFQVGWNDGSSGYGIDYTTSTLYGNDGTYYAYIETDIIPVGTLFTRRTFEQCEFLLSAPTVSGEGIKIEYRTNLTASWAGVGDTYETTTASVISDVYTINWQNVQWIQFKVSTKSVSYAAGSSGMRLREIRIR